MAAPRVRASPPPPLPKSPPRYPDLVGHRRLHLQLQILIREIGLLEEELQSLEGLQPVSKCCKEISGFVGVNPDSLVPVNRRRHTCFIWKLLRKRLHCCISWFFCGAFSFQPKRPSCGLPQCMCCLYSCCCHGCCHVFTCLKPSSCCPLEEDSCRCCVAFPHCGCHELFSCGCMWPQCPAFCPRCSNPCLL